MRSNESVGRRAADEERREQQPEVARASPIGERPQRRSRRVAAGRDEGCINGAPERRHADVAGSLPHEQRDDWNRDRGGARDDKNRRPPTVALDERREHRKKDELAGRRARGEDSERESSSLDEPSID